MTFQRKSVLITGCSDGGIGSGLALEFLRRGYQVFATARSVKKMGNLANLPNVTLLELDVLKSESIKTTAQEVRKILGTATLNILINNAGCNSYMPMLDVNIQDAKRLFDTNYFGALEVVQAFSSFVIEAKGKLVFITSIGGHVTIPYMGIYSATKRSMEIMAEHLRLELAPFGVSVLTVVTGTVQTNAMGPENAVGWKLPLGSRYTSVSDIILKRVQGAHGVAHMKLDDYSRDVVAQIERDRNGKVWCGHLAKVMQYCILLLPRYILDIITSQRTGLSQLYNDRT